MRPPKENGDNVIELTSDELRTLVEARDVLQRKMSESEGTRGYGWAHTAHGAVVDVLHAGVLRCDDNPLLDKMNEDAAGTGVTWTGVQDNRNANAEMGDSISGETPKLDPRNRIGAEHSFKGDDFHGSEPVEQHAISIVTPQEYIGMRTGATEVQSRGQFVQDDERAKFYACPTCGVRPGYKCTEATETGRKAVSYIHNSRAELVIRTKGGAPQ